MQISETINTFKMKQFMTLNQSTQDQNNRLLDHAAFRRGNMSSFILYSNNKPSLVDNHMKAPLHIREGWLSDML